LLYGNLSITFLVYTQNPPTMYTIIECNKTNKQFKLEKIFSDGVQGSELDTDVADFFFFKNGDFTLKEIETEKVQWTWEQNKAILEERSRLFGEWIRTDKNHQIFPNMNHEQLNELFNKLEQQAFQNVFG